MKPSGLAPEALFCAFPRRAAVGDDIPQLFYRRSVWEVFSTCVGGVGLQIFFLFVWHTVYFDHEDMEQFHHPPKYLLLPTCGLQILFASSTCLYTLSTVLFVPLAH